jgi:hypothetical protein
MSKDLATLIADLTSESYALELAAESVAVEAREVRLAASRLSNLDEQLRSEGSEYDGYAEAEAALGKLREVIGSLHKNADTVRGQVAHI